MNITTLVQDALDHSGTREGICCVYCPHTTAGLVINEQADPAVAHDILSYLDELIPNGYHWTHSEGNSPAHVKAALVGESVQVAFEDGKLLLGRWQGIFFCEFDGPRERKLRLAIVPAEV